MFKIYKKCFNLKNKSRKDPAKAGLTADLVFLIKN
jgi:hypothetical protein